MRVLAGVVLALLSFQTSWGQDFEIPETLEYSLGDPRGLPKITPTGAVELIYRGFSDTGETIPSATVGNEFYLVAAIPGVYRVFAWEKASPGKAKQCIITLSGGGGGGAGLSEPENLDPRLKGLAARVGAALKRDQPDPEIRRKDALMMFMLFGQLAELFERDAERAIPSFITLPSISEKLKAEESEILKGTRIESLAKGYPSVSTEAGKTFLVLFGEPVDNPPLITANERISYVLMLRTISIGAAAVAWE